VEKAGHANVKHHVMDPVEKVVHWVLLVGLLISVVLMLVGLVLGLARHAGLPSGVVAPADLWEALLSGEAGAFLTLGLLTLIVTPFVRVAGSLVAFALERDLRYVLVSAAVLTAMCLSVLLGRA
jgi:uncharacterized membrane protein